MARDIIRDAIVFTQDRGAGLNPVISRTEYSPNIELKTNPQEVVSVARKNDLVNIKTGGRVFRMTSKDVEEVGVFAQVVSKLPWRHVGIMLSYKLRESLLENQEPEELPLQVTLERLKKVAEAGLAPITTQPSLNQDEVLLGSAFSIIGQDNQVKGVVFFEEIEKNTLGNEAEFLNLNKLETHPNDLLDHTTADKTMSGGELKDGSWIVMKNEGVSVETKNNEGKYIVPAGRYSVEEVLESKSVYESVYALSIFLTEDTLNTNKFSSSNQDLGDSILTAGSNVFESSLPLDQSTLTPTQNNAGAEYDQSKTDFVHTSGNSPLEQWIGSGPINILPALPNISEK